MPITLRGSEPSLQTRSCQDKGKSEMLLFRQLLNKRRTVERRRQWQPTPVFLPGESQGRGSLVGCRLWDRTESDSTEAI